MLVSANVKQGTVSGNGSLGALMAGISKSWYLTLVYEVTCGIQN